MNSILLHTLWSSSESRLGSFVSGVALLYWKNKDLLWKTLWILQIRSLMYKNLHICMTNKFAFGFLVFSLVASTGYMKMGTEIPISEIGLFGSQLPRAAAGEAPGTPPASQNHGREVHSEPCKEIKNFPSQPCTPLIKKRWQHEAFCSAILLQK